MKIRLISLFCLICFAFAVYLSTGPSASEFCSGTGGDTISSIAFKGQMRQAILTDRTALLYLVSLPRSEALPAKAHWTSGLTFIVTLSDRWGRKGTMPVTIAEDGKYLEFMYSETLFATPDHVFSVPDTNAPATFKAMLSFLLNEENRGKDWRDGVVQK